MSDTIKLIPKDEMVDRLKASGRTVTNAVVDGIYSVDSDGNAELDIFEVYNLVEKENAQKVKLQNRNKIIYFLAAVSTLLLAANISMSFLAVHLGKQLDIDDSGEATVAGGSKVVTQGVSVRHFRLADLPMLSFDYLEQVEKVTVLYDKRLHTFNIASFEWLGQDQMNVHFDTDKYMLTTNRTGADAEVFVTETMPDGSTVKHVVWTTASTVDLTGNFDAFYTPYQAYLASVVPDECYAQLLSGMTYENGELTFPDTPPEVSRMCYEAVSLSDPLNRGGELELRVGAQDHGLAEWEINHIEATWLADGRKMGWGPLLGDGNDILTTDPFKFHEEDEASFQAYQGLFDFLGA